MHRVRTDGPTGRQRRACRGNGNSPSFANFMHRGTDDWDRPALSDFDLAKVIAFVAGNRFLLTDEADPDRFEILLQCREAFEFQTDSRQNVDQFLMGTGRLKIFTKPRSVDDHRHETNSLP